MFQYEQSLLHRLRSPIRVLAINIYHRSHNWIHKSFSNAHHCLVLAHFNRSLLLTWWGRVQIDRHKLGVLLFPFYLTGYSHIEVRDVATSVETNKDGVWINNNAAIVPSATSARNMSQLLIRAWFPKDSVCATS